MMPMPFITKAITPKTGITLNYSFVHKTQHPNTSRRYLGNHKYLNKMGVLEVTTDNGVQVIRFNRPEKRNAINHEMYKGVISTLDRSAGDDSVVLTVLTATGEYYSSGNDFSQSSDSTEIEKGFEDHFILLQNFVTAFINYPKLLIAVVNGPAFGIAATTLALCDVVYASDKAWFRTPFTQLGLSPEGCSTVTFPRIMGSAKASKMLYLNETLSANEALSSGFITEVYPDSQLMSQAFTRIHKYAQIPLQSLVLSKQLVRGWDRDHLLRANIEEVQVLKQRFQSEDFFNAMLSFRNKKSKL